MSDWVVIPCLKALQREFDTASPAGSGRDKGAEGFVGDSSHTSSSDHTPDEDSDKLRNKDSDHVNEVHAYDCDSTGPWPDGKPGDAKGSWFDAKIKHLVDLERAKWHDPNDMCRLNYVIWNRQTADKDNDFQWEPYTATSDPHTNHAHFSARYETQAENDQRPWGIAEEDMATPQEIADAVWNRHQINGIGGAQAAYQTLADTAGRTNVIMYDVKSALALLEDIKASLEAHIAGLVEASPPDGDTPA